MTKKQYAVRHVPTGSFLPSETRPINWFPLKDPVNTDTPRLTAHVRVAKNLAATWARERSGVGGQWKRQKYGNPGDEATYRAKRAELEIVEFAVSECGIVG